MAEYIEREAIKYEMWAVGPLCSLMMGVGKATVDRIPAADVAPVVHGRWEEKFFTNDRQRVCSVCHCTVRQPSYDKGETALFNYCPHCGAKMDGEG